jgi:hypothetical protein
VIRSSQAREKADNAAVDARAPSQPKEILMVSERKPETIREAVGIFGDATDLQDAIDELLSSGFHRAELSLLASKRTVEQQLGRHYDKVSLLDDTPDVPRAAYVSTEAIGDAKGGLIGGLGYVGAMAAAGAVVASGGTIAAALGASALAGGAGGIIGSILAKLVGDHHARHLQEHIERGGLLLWVRTWKPEDEARATEILTRHSGAQVHVHELPIAA